MNSALKTIPAVILAIALGAAAVAFGWDYIFNPDEDWVHYENHGELRVVGEYGSYKDCSTVMMSHKGPSGCRRVDGPFNMINTLIDKIL